MIRAHQPGSQPIDIPEVIPNPAVVPEQEPAPKEPAPKEPVKVPEKVSHKSDPRGISPYQRGVNSGLGWSARSLGGPLEHFPLDSGHSPYPAWRK
jgi:hypothetical protein